MSIKSNVDFFINNLPQDVNLIAVSKTRSVDEIMEAHAEGIRDFGENKVQELIYKYDSLPKDINWHLIGHLQRNKVKYIVGKVALIHSLDNIKLLQELEKRYIKENLKAQVLIQINIGNERSKTGIHLDNLEALIYECTRCNHVIVRGVMAIIPKVEEKDARRYFRSMSQIFQSIKERNLDNFKMDYLSMGMSGDYEWAILEGSNMIRIGQGIFGKRNYKNE